VTKLDEAFRMLDAFTSVGARSFVVTNTDINQARLWPLPYLLAKGIRHVRAEEAHFDSARLCKALPDLMRLAAIRSPQQLEDGRTIEAGHNLIIRPTGPGVHFVQLDDLSATQLDHVRPAAFIIHATSPGSHQAWIAVSGLPNDKAAFKEFMRRVRKAVGGNDKSASHATRLAGSENFKEKYSGAFPVVTITESAPGRVMTPAQLEALGLLAPPVPYHAPTVLPLKPHGRRWRTDWWPDYGISLASAGPARNHAGPDRSAADFNWCLAAIGKGGRGVEETAETLLKVSPNAQGHKRRGEKGYALITAQNAATFIDHRKQGQGR
jgi:hypothetical protein